MLGAAGERVTRIGKCISGGQGAAGGQGAGARERVTRIGKYISGGQGAAGGQGAGARRPPLRHVLLDVPRRHRRPNAPPPAPRCTPRPHPPPLRGRPAGWDGGGGRGGGGAAAGAAGGGGGERDLLLSPLCSCAASLTPAASPLISDRGSLVIAQLRRRQLRPACSLPAHLRCRCDAALSELELPAYSLPAYLRWCR